MLADADEPIPGSTGDLSTVCVECEEDVIDVEEVLVVMVGKEIDGSGCEGNEGDDDISGHVVNVKSFCLVSDFAPVFPPAFALAFTVTFEEPDLDLAFPFGLGFGLGEAALPFAITDKI